ncbi:2-phosphosulfolactate phosphatase [Pseudolysinimonas sp.]|uniref:2-phosphosulfolactate phosphatase n=1 Tax=Pseudolysinimonas sp. TaxID=2680009 RepID=UPI003F7F1B4F
MSVTQAPVRVQLEWGAVGALDVLAQGPLPVTAVVVDVLSFSTAVTVAAERGTAVVPVPSSDPAVGREIAERLGATLAGRRGDGRVSLSPASLLRFDGELLVLPSPNGATISAALRGAGADVVAGSLRHAAAVARHAVARPGRILLVPAGERWPDGSLRPALEDLLGAGAIAAALRSGGAELSPEATAAAGLWTETPDPADAVRRSTSGRELDVRGFAEDVEIAVAIDASTVVPVLTDPEPAFRAERVA